MIIKITPDKVRAKSMLDMAKNTEIYVSEIIEKVGIKENQSPLVRDYYEVIRELITAIMFCDGLKVIGEMAHKEAIDYLTEYKEFSQDEINELQDLRDRRNKSSYEGRPIKSPYLENKKEKLDLIIEKLNKALEKKLK